MKIDYKITTIILGVLLLGTYAWHWETILFHNRGDMMGGMHKMPDGTMMQNSPIRDTSMQGMMMDMTANLVGKTGKELEKVFITDMIPHHQGAVDMAKILVADPSVSEQMKQFGRAIITAQEKEIRDMNEWLTAY